MRRWVVGTAAAVLLLAALLVRALGLAGVHRRTGYFSPVFAADGRSIYAIRRVVTATVIGPGQSFFTPPARVWIHRDRFSLVALRLPDGQVSVLDELPPSPLEGASLTEYHGAIFGTPHAHLRRTGSRIEYEVAVTRSEIPFSRTLVLEGGYEPDAGRAAHASGWTERHPAMTGDEPAQLHGDLEVIAVPGDELMPCAIAVLRTGEPGPRSLIQTGTCARKFPGGLGADVVTPLSRRGDIERAELVRRTYADLVERGRQSGLSEGQAMLAANKEMSRLGLYPRTTTLAAAAADCASASPLFRIAREEFAAGLFQDIAQAIASPGEQVDKSIGAYVTHRDYATSQEINAFLERGNTVFHVRTGDGCWRLTIDRPR